MRPFPPPSPGDYLWVRLPKCWVRGVAMAFLAVLIPLAVFHRALFNAVGDWLVVEAPCEKADVIVVLAGDRGERLFTAVDLYKMGKAPKMLMSGGPIVGDATWAAIMKQQAVAHGVPAADIWIQDRSVSTTEDARYTKEILQARHVHSMYLVTSNYHTRRAAATFRRVLGSGYEIAVKPVTPSWWPEGWWRCDLGRLCVFNEYVKMAWVRLAGAEY